MTAPKPKVTVLTTWEKQIPGYIAAFHQIAVSGNASKYIGGVVHHDVFETDRKIFPELLEAEMIFCVYRVGVGSY